MSTLNRNAVYTGTSFDDEDFAGSGDDHQKGFEGEDTLAGGQGNDTIEGGSGNDHLIGDNVDSSNDDEHYADADRIHGQAGEDQLQGQQGNDLLAGDGSGEEWQLINGEWVFDQSKMSTNNGPLDTDNDFLEGGEGNDVLNGGIGEDTHIGGAGEDRINAGIGNDIADGGLGNDQINLEDGNDLGTGGLGADTIHAGAGNDVVYGDLGNVLDNGDYGTDPHVGIGFSFLGSSGDWSGGDAAVNAENVQIRTISQSIETNAGEPYSMNFDLALNSLASKGAVSVEVYWNGELIDVVAPDGALFQQFTFDVVGTGGNDLLKFREIIELDHLGTSQQVFTQTTEIDVSGVETSVEGFAPGQANLYQVISDQLYIFDTETQEYNELGDGFGFNVNAAGFNPANNLIYGFATNNSPEVDANGNFVSKHDLVAIDATGNAYRIGHVGLEDAIGNASVYIGDFGPDGALYVMNGGHRSEVFRVDINQSNADGSLVYESIPLPENLLGGFADWAWVESQQAFLGVNQGGYVYKIDPFNLTDGMATVESVRIESLVTENGTINGIPSGSAWGAVFTDAQGNLYAGLNRGDHDLDASTAISGGVYQITGFETGTAQAVLLADAPITGSNDGASDPRSLSTFTPTDGDASILINNISLTGTSGDNDLITGGTGNDRVFGEGGADEIFGQDGNDIIDGGVGDDKLFADQGNDFVSGGIGADHVEGGVGMDTLSGNDGDDFILGNSGADRISGDAGADKLVGGSGGDTIEGGQGDDHIWGGEWTGDGESDLFVFSPGSGQDMIHDFEVDQDILDLSAYSVNWSDLQSGVQDHGWAVSIELGELGGAPGDRIFLVNVSSDELSEDNFSLGA